MRVFRLKISAQLENYDVLKCVALEMDCEYQNAA